MHDPVPLPPFPIDPDGVMFSPELITWWGWGLVLGLDYMLPWSWGCLSPPKS